MNKTILIAGVALVGVAALFLLRPTGTETDLVQADGVVTETLDGESTANMTEQETSNIGDASNAATDEAVAEIQSGDAPTSEEVVEESREIAEAEGVVGAEAYMVDSYDREVVMSGLEGSELDETVKTQLAADLDAAEGDEAALSNALDDVRSALNID